MGCRYNLRTPHKASLSECLIIVKIIDSRFEYKADQTKPLEIKIKRRRELMSYVNNRKGDE